ncbi:MAG: hypothetical protein H6725_04330 [Sandaracinaceae bacterium]|nr:hypothetical protein [Sandaracinaceae bacterium]
MSVAAWLQHAGAQHDVVEWARPFGTDWNAAMAACPRADWLLSIAARLHLPREALARAAMACVRVAHAGREMPEVALAALESVHAWAIHWEPFANCGKHAALCEEAATHAKTPAEAALLNAVAAVARVPDDPYSAAAAATYAVELSLAQADDDELMSVMLSAQSSCVQAARVHLPLALFEAARGA